VGRLTPTPGLSPGPRLPGSVVGRLPLTPGRSPPSPGRSPPSPGRSPPSPGRSPPSPGRSPPRPGRFPPARSPGAGAGLLTPGRPPPPGNPPPPGWGNDGRLTAPRPGRGPGRVMPPGRPPPGAGAGIGVGRVAKPPPGRLALPGPIPPPPGWMPPSPGRTAGAGATGRCTAPAFGSAGRARFGRCIAPTLGRWKFGVWGRAAAAGICGLAIGACGRAAGICGRATGICGRAIGAWCAGAGRAWAWAAGPPPPPTRPTDGRPWATETTPWPSTAKQPITARHRTTNRAPAILDRMVIVLSESELVRSRSCSRSMRRPTGRGPISDLPAASSIRLRPPRPRARGACGPRRP
jgi:hypothetical protein